MKQNEKMESLQSLKNSIAIFLTSDDKVNCYPIRFHRLYLDGSYGDIADSRNGGEQTYKLHLSKYSKNLKEETLKKEAISTFKNFVCIEFYQRQYIPRIGEIDSILKEVLKDEYDNFISMLVNNIKDFK